MAAYQSYVVRDVEVRWGGGVALHTFIPLMRPKHYDMYSKVHFFLIMKNAFSCLSGSAPSQFFFLVEVDD